MRGIRISAGSGAAALTPEQKRFNTLIRQIEQARAALAAWHDNIPLYLQAHAKTLLPLWAALAAARKERVFAFDMLLDQPGWNKTERATLRELVCDGVAELIEGANEDDPVLKALFDKHAEVDLDTERQESRRAFKGLIEEMAGIDLGDDDEIDSEEALFKRMHEAMAGKQAAAQPRQAQAAGRRKTAAQKRREAEEQLATQSVREIFRKLASALHPDRETDPARREEKTVLMQKVNQAYAANDLLTLLELQLEIEQVDAGHIATASAQRLKHYNKVLTEQLAELKAEATRMEMGFRVDFNLGPGWGMNPARLVGLVGQQARDLRDGVAMIQHELRVLADKTATKRWLKQERQRQRQDPFDSNFF